MSLEAYVYPLKFCFILDACITFKIPFFLKSSYSLPIFDFEIEKKEINFKNVIKSHSNSYRTDSLWLKEVRRFLPQMFIWKTELSLTQKLSFEHENSPFG